MTECISIKRARALRRDATPEERMLWRCLRAAQANGYKFRRQAPIGPYIVDFVCHARKLIVELDGSQHTLEGDAPRTAFLESQGYRLLRFPNHEVICELEGVLGKIWNILPPHPPGYAGPLPLPQGERG